MRVRVSVALSVVIGVIALEKRALADQGFALNRFEPSDRGSDWFVGDSLDLRGHKRPAAGVVGDWGYKPLVAYNADGTERGAIVEHQIFAHLGASMVLWNRARAAFDLPLALYQTGDAVPVNGVRTNVPGSAVGDVRLAADVRLFGEYGKPVTGALGVALQLPTGLRDQYTSDGNVRLTPRASVAGDIGVFAYAARFGFNYRPLTERVASNPLGSELTLSASAGVRLIDRKLLVGPEIFGSTVTTPGSFFEKSTTPLEWILGAHYDIGSFRVGAGAGTGLTRGWGAPVVRTLLSAEWVPGVEVDTDHDGIPDGADACPLVPGVRTKDPRTNGCPPAPPAPPADRDGDGIPDASDACPDVPGVKSDDPAKNGCPPDRDGDGVPDAVDACPDVAGVKSDDPSKNGCPPDRDGDKIPDAVDACPDVPGVASEDATKNGCPPDRDGDGIIDAEDACPDAPGPDDPDPTKKGCPLARIEGGQVRITEQVKFKTDSAELLHESEPVLLAVAVLLKSHPEITKVRVEGHTDNRGRAAYNKELSKKRAASVVKWLVGKGIDKSRLVSNGYGLERPLLPNDTDEGRQANRRVEFHIEATGTPPEAKPDAKPAPKP